MLVYIAHCILIMIPTLLLISVISFIVIELPPGNMADAYIARMMEQQEEKQFTEETMRQIENLERKLGLDKPMWQRYFVWFAGANVQNVLLDQRVFFKTAVWGDEGVRRGGGRAWGVRGSIFFGVR